VAFIGNDRKKSVKARSLPEPWWSRLPRTLKLSGAAEKQAPRQPHMPKRHANRFKDFSETPSREKGQTKRNTCISFSLLFAGCILEDGEAVSLHPGCSLALLLPGHGLHRVRTATLPSALRIVEQLHRKEIGSINAAGEVTRVTGAAIVVTGGTTVL
jgi:hypothetical protein